MKLAKLACEIVLPATALLGLLRSRKNDNSELHLSQDPAPDPTLAERVKLRQAHQVRLVQGMEEGLPFRKLPNGVYGFTFAPGAEDFGLFGKDSYLAFEVHIADEARLLAYVTEQDAKRLEQLTEHAACDLYPVPHGEATTLAAVPISLIAKARPLDRSRANCLHIDVRPSDDRVASMAF